MADVGSNTRGPTDVVEGKLGDMGVELEEEGKRLADTSAGAEDGDLGLAGCGGGEGAGVGGEGAGGGAGEHGDGRECFGEGTRVGGWEEGRESAWDASRRVLS